MKTGCVPGEENTMATTPRRKSDAARRANQVIRRRTLLVMLVLGICLCVALGVAVYGLAAWKTGTVKKDDLPARLRRKFK